MEARADVPHEAWSNTLGEALGGVAGRSGWLTHLELIRIPGLCDASVTALQLLADSIASSRRLRVVSVVPRLGSPQAQVDALRPAVVANASLRRLACGDARIDALVAERNPVRRSRVRRKRR